MVGSELGSVKIQDGSGKRVCSQSVPGGGGGLTFQIGYGPTPCPLLSVFSGHLDQVEVWPLLYFIVGLVLFSLC